MPSPNRPTGPYTVVPDSDYLNRSIMVVCGPGGVRERIESATEARRTCDIANIAHAAGKRAVEGDAILALRQIENLLAFHEGSAKPEFDGAWPTVRINGDDYASMLGDARKALASAGQEVKHGE